MIVIITGANRGIGKETVKTLLEHHKKPTIILTTRNIQFGQETLQNFSALYPTDTHRLFYHPLDLTSAQSTTEFIDWFKPKFTTYDILINNAAINEPKEFEDPNYKMPLDIQKAIIDTNFYSTVIFTEKMLPFLSNEGKIFMISSSAGQLLFQGEPIRKFLSQDTMTFDDLWNKMKEFEEKAPRYEHIEFGYSQIIYRVSKAFLNAYTRFVLKRKLGKCQTCFNIHPGWIKTRMGGPNAPLPIEEGVVSILRVLNMGLEESLKLNGEFFNQDGSLFEY